MGTSGAVLDPIDEGALSGAVIKFNGSARHQVLFYSSTIVGKPICELLSKGEDPCFKLLTTLSRNQYNWSLREKDYVGALVTFAFQNLIC